MPPSSESSESQDRDKRAEPLPVLTEEQRQEMNEKLQEKLEAAKKELRAEKDLEEDEPKEAEKEKEKDRDRDRRHRRSEEKSGRGEGSSRRHRDTGGSGRRRDTDRRDTDRRRDTRAEADEPDARILEEQQPSRVGLYCRYYGVDNCRKYLGSSWGYKQHLACKHSFSKSFAESFVSKQWTQLEAHFGPVPPPEEDDRRPKASLRPAAETKDMRRPAEPARPPKAPRSSRASSEASAPSAPSQSSDANAAGIELLRAMWQDVATRVFKDKE